eukprot:g5289.t1
MLFASRRRFCRSLGQFSRYFSFSPASHFFQDVEQAPKDPILGITENFLADKNPNKMNLGVGAYRDDKGQPMVLQAVREAEKRVAGHHYMEYLPIGGLKEFCNLSVGLAYGTEAAPVKESRVASIQALSGTGACRIMAEFQKRWMPGTKVYMPKPTWSNHHNIWRDAGVEFVEYKYYKPETCGLNFEAMMDDFKTAPNGSVILLHACAHNPTGVDPTIDQWKEISKLIKEKGHFPFFDMAYQGFASGDCDKDAQAIRIFIDDGHQIGLAQSYAKNMGLYGQRIGCLSLVASSSNEATKVESQLKNLARPMYSNPPMHGALLVVKILTDETLKALWYKEVKDMADRIISMRTKLRSALEGLGSSIPWQHITDQIGMFCFSGMTPEQVDRLASEYSIYMTRNGRISMAGVTSSNVTELAKAINEVTK